MGQPAWTPTTRCAPRPRPTTKAFWARQARELLSWKTPFTKTLDESNAPFFKWFEDGTLNASYNCLDRQVEAGLGDKVALIFEADDGKPYRASPTRTCSRAPAAWPTRSRRAA